MKLHLRPAHQWLSPKLIGFALAALLLTSATAFVACSDLVGSDAAMDEAASKTEVFSVVEQMPELIGGLKAIQEQLHYPKIAKEAGIEGRVIVQFVVDKEGRVVDPEIVKGLGAGLDKEALRVISLARFKPGKQAGKTISVKMSLPFTFKLNASGTTSNNVRILDESLTITHPEMDPEEMNALLLIVLPAFLFPQKSLRCDL